MAIKFNEQQKQRLTTFIDCEFLNLHRAIEKSLVDLARVDEDLTEVDELLDSLLEELGIEA